MDACSALDTTAGSPAPGRKPKIAFVAEQFVPPAYDGSTYVYKKWVDFLADACELYGIFFAAQPGDTTAAERYLGERCTAHLILPGTPSGRLWKTLRAVSRHITGALFAPRWIEELGRGPIHRRIADFSERHGVDLFIVSKLACVPLLGEGNIRRLDAGFILDMHDDFVARDKADRRVLAALTTQFPALRRYPSYRNMRLRHLLSRLVERRARAQERRLCALFDCACPSSPEELAAYRPLLQHQVPCELLGWPPGSAASDPATAGPAMAPRCHAGFIGGDYPFNLEGVIHFCTHILPLIRRRCPGFRFLVTGRVAAPLRLAAPFWPGVELCDHVADAQTFYDQIRVSVVPLLSGTGVSIKTLEALRFGKPVVSTTVGARGVATGAGQPLLDIADDPEAFAERVVARCAEPAAASAAAPAQAEAGLAEAEFRRAFDALIGRYLRGRAASLRPVAEGGGWGSLETGAAPR